MIDADRMRDALRYLRGGYAARIRALEAEIAELRRQRDEAYEQAARAGVTIARLVNRSHLAAEELARDARVIAGGACCGTGCCERAYGGSE